MVWDMNEEMRVGNPVPADDGSGRGNRMKVFAIGIEVLHYLQI